MTNVHRQRVVLKTECKAWNCKACRKKKLALVTAKMEYGCMTLEQCWLVSVTYVRTGDPEWISTGRSLKTSSTIVLGPVANRRLRKFVANLSQHYQSKIAMFQVPELTKKAMLHHHMILGFSDNTTAQKPCMIKATYSKKWRATKCNCIEHIASKIWHTITGDSYVVDARLITTPTGVARYLGKYLSKQFDGRVRDELEARDFKRRYSYNRAWPSGGSMQRLGTLRSNWVDIKFQFGWTLERMVQLTQDIDDAQLIGNNITQQIHERRQQAGRKMRLRRFQDATSQYETILIR